MTDQTSQLLKATLLEQGRSKRWLAGRLGIQESYLVAMLNGRRPLQRHYALRIAEILGVPAALIPIQPEPSVA